MKNLKKIPTSRLIYDAVYASDTNALDYLKKERLTWLKEKDKESLIERDRRLIVERGVFLNNYIHTTNPTFEELYNILFTENMYNKLTFSEQIVLMIFFKNIATLLKSKENLATKIIDKSGSSLEKSIIHMKDSYKIEYLREEYEQIMHYWNILNKLEFSYNRKAKDLLNRSYYILGIENDLLNDSILDITRAKLTIKNEMKLMKYYLSRAYNSIKEIKECELMSEEEKNIIKKLELIGDK